MDLLFLLQPQSVFFSQMQTHSFMLSSFHIQPRVTGCNPDLSAWKDGMFIVHYLPPSHYYGAAVCWCGPLLSRSKHESKLDHTIILHSTVWVINIWQPSFGLLTLNLLTKCHAHANACMLGGWQNLLKVDNMSITPVSIISCSIWIDQANAMNCNSSQYSGFRQPPTKCNN